MTFAREGERVILDMATEDYNQLMIMLGYATGAASKEDMAMFWRWIQFVNRMNRTNDEYIPYVIPDEFREPR